MVMKIVIIIGVCLIEYLIVSFLYATIRFNSDWVISKGNREIYLSLLWPFFIIIDLICIPIYLYNEYKNRDYDSGYRGECLACDENVYVTDDVNVYECGSCGNKQLKELTHRRGCN